MTALRFSEFARASFAAEAPSLDMFSDAPLVDIDPVELDWPALD
jgi:hypothetical protein